MTEEEKDFAKLSETIYRLEEEVRALKASSNSAKERRIIKAISARVNKIFSRENLEMFLSLTSLVISSAIAIYLVYFQ